jgi:hypothetical protein
MTAQRACLTTTALPHIIISTEPLDRRRSQSSGEIIFKYHVVKLRQGDVCLTHTCARKANDSQRGELATGRGCASFVGDETCVQAPVTEEARVGAEPTWERR